MSILGSAYPIFRGDRSRYKPAESVVAAISGCHMLWYLHFLLLSRISARLRRQMHPCV
ncbi:MAG: hypothetical protein H0X49_00095 [Acidobacteria bacterium]|nr:hypothetical protein [Acidobacteriota bacterium]